MAQLSRRRRPDSHHKSKWRLAGRVIGGILAIALVVVITLVMLVLHTPPPPTVQLNALSAQRLDEDFRRAAATAQSGTPSEVRADETQVNSKVQELLQAFRSAQQRGGNESLKDLRIKLVGDRIEAYLLIDYQGRKLAFQITGKIHTVNGYVQFEPESAKVGALPIPKSRLESTAKKMMSASNSPLLYRLPPNMSDIRVEDGKVVFVVK